MRLPAADAVLFKVDGKRKSSNDRMRSVDAFYSERNLSCRSGLPYVDTRNSKRCFAGRFGGIDCHRLICLLVPKGLASSNSPGVWHKHFSVKIREKIPWKLVAIVPVVSHFSPVLTPISCMSAVPKGNESFPLRCWSALKNDAVRRDYATTCRWLHYPDREKLQSSTMLTR